MQSQHAYGGLTRQVKFSSMGPLLGTHVMVQQDASTHMLPCHQPACLVANGTSPLMLQGSVSQSVKQLTTLHTQHCCAAHVYAAGEHMHAKSLQTTKMKECTFTRLQGRKLQLFSSPLYLLRRIHHPVSQKTAASVHYTAVECLLSGAPC